MTGLPEFYRTDAPAVAETGTAQFSCATCMFWSRWLSEAGDCLFYALRRRRAIIAGATSADLPPKSARVTSASEVCAGWAARPDQEALADPVALKLFLQKMGTAAS